MAKPAGACPESLKVRVPPRSFGNPLPGKRDRCQGSGPDTVCELECFTVDAGTLTGRVHLREGIRHVDFICLPICSGHRPPVCQEDLVWAMFQLNLERDQVMVTQRALRVDFPLGPL